MISLHSGMNISLLTRYVEFWQSPASFNLASSRGRISQGLEGQHSLRSDHIGSLLLTDIVCYTVLYRMTLAGFCILIINIVELHTMYVHIWWLPALRCLPVEGQINKSVLQLPKPLGQFLRTYSS